MPTWDVNLNVPLLNDKYFVSDLIDSVNFFMNEDNSVVFQTSGDLRTTPIGEIVIPMDIDTGDLDLHSGILLTSEFPLSNFQTGREVSYGLISEGELRVTFSNMHNTVSNVTFTLTNILDEDNEPLVIEYDGNAGGHLIPLAGYRVGTPGSDIIVQNIDFTVLITSSEPTNSFVGNLRLSMTDDLVFSVFRGRIPSMRVDIEDNDTYIDVDYPWGIEEAIQLESAEIELDIYNPIAYPLLIHGDFYAVNSRTGNSTVISLEQPNGNPYTINPRTGDEPGYTHIVFSNNVPSLLRVMPDSIFMRNSYFDLDNSSGTIGEMYSTDKITGDYIAKSPFTFTLYAKTITTRDTIDIEVSKENRDTIRKNVLSAEMIINIFNQLPIGTETTLYFGTSPDIVPEDTNSYAFTKTTHILAKPANSDLDIPTQAPVYLGLTHEELQLFTNPTVYMKLAFTFDASDGPVTITASPTDYIQLQISIGVETHVEE